MRYILQLFFFFFWFIIVDLNTLLSNRCEPFSSYPRTYDLVHANYLFSHYSTQGDRCLLEDIMLEMDRLVRPQVAFFFMLKLHIYP